MLCADLQQFVSSMMYVVISNMLVAASPRGPLQAARIRRSATRAPPVVYAIGMSNRRGLHGSPCRMRLVM